MSGENYKEKIIIVCPNCRQKLGIPKIAATLQVTCPKCGTSFEYPAEGRRRKKTKWLRNKVKRHPILFGLILTVWVLFIANSYRNGTLALTNGFFAIGGCLALWLLGTWIMDKLKEEGVKWYYRKWFVLLMLFIFPLYPIGLTLLWVGSRFRKPTKIGLSVVFGLLFAVNILSPYRVYYSPKDEIAELLTGSRPKTFLKPAPYYAKQRFRDEFLSRPYSWRMTILAPSQIFKMWQESVVLLTASDKRGNEIGQGSGFVITEKGAIVTNFHVIQSAYNVSIEFIDGAFYREAFLIKGYPSYDIAILQMREVRYELTPVIIGDSEYVEVGEEVVTISNPLGLQNTFTRGMISGIRPMDGFELLQIDAPISPGSSGGALFNMQGEVIGIITIGSLWEAQNLNFAIPINLLTPIVEELP